MKTKLMLAAAVLAVFAAPARAEMGGVPSEMQFWLLVDPAVLANASWLDRRFESQWRGMVVQSVPSAPTREQTQISGVPKEVQFWLLQPTVPVAEAGVVRQLRETTGQAR